MSGDPKPSADWKPAAAFLAYLAVVIGAGIGSGWIAALVIAGVLGLVIVGLVALFGLVTRG